MVPLLFRLPDRRSVGKGEVLELLDDEGGVLALLQVIGEGNFLHLVGRGLELARVADDGYGHSRSLLRRKASDIFAGF